MGPGSPSDGGPPTFHPGVWNHFCLTWDRSEPHVFQLYRNHANRWHRADRLTAVRKGERPAAETSRPLYIEFGVSGERSLGQGREPLIMIDEVIAYNYALIPNEVTQAYKRIQEELAPIKLYDLAPDYKYSIAELSARFETLLPRGVTADVVLLEAIDVEGKTIGKPLTRELVDGKANFLIAENRPIPSGIVTFKVKATDVSGKVVIDDEYKEWGYIRRPWRGNTIGVPLTAPAPWTPIVAKGKRLETCMIQYELGDNGLPVRILAKGKDLLAQPVRLLENGKPMRATGLRMGPSKDVDMSWSSAFEGETCSIDMQCRLEFDGLIRFELVIHPRGKVAPIDFEIPLKAEYATRRLYQSCTRWGAIQARTDQPAVLTPRHEALAPAQAKWERDRRRTGEKPTIETLRAWNFWSQMDLNDLERGLYWFADNAAGWHQTDRHPAQEFRKSGAEHAIVCHLVAEPTDYTDKRPIVFGILPHPARPLPDDYRYFGNGPSPRDPNAGNLFGSTFYPWPTSPTAGDMKIYPAKQDWDYAESLVPQMKAVVKGYRTLYQSIGYMSCRAGSYDHWEWRNANGGRISLTRSFVEYCTWEMNEWIKRGIFDAIYLDDSYAVICNNEAAVKAGQAIRLPNGQIQGGHRIWEFRELMKRWRQLFVNSGRRPMLISHHSNHWMYPGMVFCETTLDGEGSPTITIGGRRDFIDALNMTRFEVVSNPHLWGVSRFYMPSIWEKGPGNKGAGGGKPWAWRMARSAQAMLAHMENPISFADEGTSVYKSYWKEVLGWGAGKTEVTFIPYYRAAPYVTVDDQGSGSLVSVYRDKGRALVIASNRLPKDRELAVTLDLQTLGLPPKPGCKALDFGYTPPPGLDPWLIKDEMPATPTVGIGEDGDLRTDELEDFSLDDGTETVAAAAKAAQPTIRGHVLTIPVRSHDYRIVAVE